MSATIAVKGRFAPSPSGRMHLGNVYAALMSWALARSRGGTWLLRIEDLDPQRCRPEYARLLEDDLRWLGLHWDEGGLDATDPMGFPYVQSGRHALYLRALEKLNAMGLVYPCRCTRAEIRTAQAPHASDGRTLYPGTCRPPVPQVLEELPAGVNLRLRVPETMELFTDFFCGRQSFSPAREHGDIVLRRSDGAWAYQLAVVVDDALMGVTQVARGADLLSSAALQRALYRLLDFPIPEFAHFPLICSADGVRLSKRDSSLAMDVLRASLSPGKVIAMAARHAGLGSYTGLSLLEFLDLFCNRYC